MFKLRVFLSALVACSALLSPAYAGGGKPVIAIGEISSSYSDITGSSFRSMLETAIAETGKFELIERSRMNDLLQEQGMSDSGLLDGNLDVGGISGVDYLLYGTITQAKLDSKNQLVMTTCEGTLGVDARIVDVVSGSIRVSESVVVKQQLATGNADQNPCRGLTGGSFREAERKAADKLASHLAYSLFPIKVIKVSDSRVYLNYGSNTLEEGDFLKLVSVGESFVDPDTGEELGAEEEDAGLLEVEETRDKFTIARIVGSYVPVEIGFVANSISSREGKALAKELKRKRR